MPTAPAEAGPWKWSVRHPRDFAWWVPFGVFRAWASSQPGLAGLARR